MAEKQNDPRPGEPGIVLTPSEARQGLRDRPVLMVLAASLVLAAIVWAFMYYNRSPPAPPGQPPAPPAQPTTPPATQGRLIGGTAIG